MSWHFSLALEAAFSEASSLDGERFAPWKSMPFAQDDSCSAKMKATFHRSQYGMMFVPLTDSLGVDLLTWFQGGSHAKASASQEMAKDSTTQEVDYGPSNEGSLAKFDPDSRSWKTHQFSLHGGLEPFSGTWPSWGSMRNGELSARVTWARGMIAPAYGFWLSTPCASESKDRGNADMLAKLDRGGRLARNICNRFWKDRQPIKVQLNPCFAEMSMDWPIGWTARTPLATVKFHQWLSMHGIY